MKTVIVLSGGLDSTTLAYDLKQRGHTLYAISFNYGQKHSRELQKAATTCDKLGIPHTVVDLSTQLSPLLASSLTRDDQPVPEGHYEDENMRSTVVPNRNMIMLAIAAGYAVTVGADRIAYAAHAGDHAIYPDCRPEFRDAMQRVLSICHFTPIDLMTPYVHLHKGEIAAIGKALAVPYEDTWTCYVGAEKPCKKCGACQERAEAMEFAGLEDPLCSF